jgi:hypothetical protein
MIGGDTEPINIQILSKIEKDPNLFNNPDLQFNVFEYFKLAKDANPPTGCSITNDGQGFACSIYNATDVIEMDNGDGSLTFDEFVKEEMSQYLLCRLLKKLCQGSATMELFQYRFSQIAEGVKNIDETYKAKYAKDNSK